MKTVTCCNCVTIFGMTDEVYEYKKRTGDSFWCPNGHCQYFTENKNAINLLSKVKQRLKQKRDCFLKKRNTYTIGGKKWEIYDSKVRVLADTLNLMNGEPK